MIKTHFSLEIPDHISELFNKIASNEQILKKDLMLEAIALMVAVYELAQSDPESLIAKDILSIIRQKRVAKC